MFCRVKCFFEVFFFMKNCSHHPPAGISHFSCRWVFYRHNRSPPSRWLNTAQIQCLMVLEVEVQHRSHRDKMKMSAGLRSFLQAPGRVCFPAHSGVGGTQVHGDVGPLLPASPWRPGALVFVRSSLHLRTSKETQDLLTLPSFSSSVFLFHWRTLHEIRPTLIMWGNLPVLRFLNRIISANSLFPYKKHSQVAEIKAWSCFGKEALLWLLYRGCPPLALLGNYLLITCLVWICWFLSTLPNCSMGISLQPHTEDSLCLIFLWVLSLSPSCQLTTCFMGFLKKDVRDVRYF